MSQIAQIDNRWKLTGDVVVGNAKAILTASQPFTITNNTMVDFENVNDVDTAAVSLILEWKRRAKKEDKVLTFVNLPANLTSLVALYGVEDLIV